MASCGSKKNAAANDEEKIEPTVVPYAKFDADTDVEYILKAVTGMGTDEKLLTRLVVTRTTPQLKQVMAAYKKKKDKSLVKMLSGELRGNLETCVINRFHTYGELSARLINQAVTGAGADSKILYDTILTKTKDEMDAVKKAYKRMYPNNDLMKDVTDDTKKEFQYLLATAIKNNRAKEGPVDAEKAKESAQDLADATDPKSAADEEKFANVCLGRPLNELRVAFKMFHKMTKRDIEKAISSEFDGTMKKAALVLVEWIKDPIGFWALMLRQAMKGIGTDTKKLIRVLSARADIDLGSVKARYKKNYGKSVYHHISKEGKVQGDFQRFLLMLVGPDPEDDPDLMD